MADYIDREILLKFIEDGLNYPDRASTKAFGHDGVEIMAHVHFMPAADVAPVVHGHWVIGDSAHYCSACHAPALVAAEVDDESTLYYHTRHCPFCGAEMNGGTDNAKA